MRYNEGVRLLASVLVSALAVAGTLTGPPAHAQTDEARKKAREHYQRSKRAFELGRYDEAISGYEEAYRLIDEPALLYNLGQAHRLAGHNVEALRAYRNFLIRNPDAPNRSEVEKKIALLERAIEDQRQAQKQPPDHAIDPKITPPPDAEPKQVEPKPVVAKQVIKERPRRGLVIAGGVTLSIGVGGLGGGAACALLGAQTTEQLRRDSVEGKEFDPGLQSRGKLYNGLMGGLMAVGVVGVAAGSALLALGMKPRPSSRAVLVLPLLATDRVGLWAGGNF